MAGPVPLCRTTLSYAHPTILIASFTRSPQMKRLLDIVLAALSLLVLSVPMLLVALAVRFTSKGPALYWSDRVGKDNRIFRMPKFRTMQVGTPQLATHLLLDSKTWLTPIGALLRKTSVDELPQLWSVLIGHMSLVGPRPALFNQDDLIHKRTLNGIHTLAPGLTGWAQVHGRDELSVDDKVASDLWYLRNRSLRLDLCILCMTVWKVARRDGVVQADEAKQNVVTGCSSRAS